MKRILKKNINVKPYWDNLLKSGEWGKERGQLYLLLAKYLPRKQKATVLDIGCAIGHGTVKLAKKLPNAEFEACDFSARGIKNAKRLYGKEIKFFVHDLNKDKLAKKYDYILFVETLEHLTNPIKVVRRYMEYCSKKMLVTVPYKERGWKEHLYSFDKNSFKKIKEFKKCFVLRKPLADTPNSKIILYLFEKSR